MTTSQQREHAAKVAFLSSASTGPKVKARVESLKVHFIKTQRSSLSRNHPRDVRPFELQFGLFSVHANENAQPASPIHHRSASCRCSGCRPTRRYNAARIWRALYASGKYACRSILSKSRPPRVSHERVQHGHFPTAAREFTPAAARARRVSETLWSGTVKYQRSEAMWNCVSQLSNLIQFSLFSLKSVPKHHTRLKTSKLCVAPLHGFSKKNLEKRKHIESCEL
ncbi:Hypothetical_protein [Hexamita inflata]|uniref:Hypothetical_protein n=1 Tax=Hexamita inflata TaxID=28002 RepID=A0AA86QQ12_9EUKA|nr:Hypothetical protein HINF_LOCUS49723 [Hexamita inflata]